MRDPEMDMLERGAKTVVDDGLFSAPQEGAQPPRDVVQEAGSAELLK